ncbi:cubilin-like isoform X2 [Amphibalanus amphitrite]|uniref:cubilin-like isoform X2 n=1 Tax=Amphibalanus amphitrite TaxID=1232801 RepID=UPI001C90072C|nr:cubilin-like isoform X2 [Amphibalanus amphitrite]
MRALGWALLALLLAVGRSAAQVDAAAGADSDGPGPEGDPDRPFVPLSGAKCDRVYVSREDQDEPAPFEAPTLHNPLGHSRQCLLKFIAQPHQRVKISFRLMRLRGTYPDCQHEYLDVFSELRRPDEDLLETPFGGRFCGMIAPRARISLYNSLVLGFYTDQAETDGELFYGTYQFINASKYELGTPIPGSPCSFEINHSNQKRKGLLVSPTYPGVYPKGLNCEYRFVGKPGQRIRLEFRDFDLFMGGHHCPFDFVRIYDGANQSAPLIGTFCRPERNLVKYSTGHQLLMTFVTIQRTPNPEKRGFSGIYEFSESFVNLDFITGQHIRGTECDQRILSKRESSGMVYSPNYPFPYLQNIVCKYFIYGMKDSQNLERVLLMFDMFDVPGEALQTGTTIAEYDSDTDKGCDGGYVRIYLRGQEVKEAFDKFDRELCGRQVPESVRSNGARLTLVFSSGATQGSGFKANFKFETEYLIPGTAAPDGSCRFTYNSAAGKRGDFNSPRHPANYPSATACEYTFETQRNEQVRLVFDNFKVRAENINGSAYGVHNCHEDWLEIYNIYYDNSTDLIARYCNQSTPGPTESIRGARGLRVILHSDADHVSSGFKAKYIFLNAKDIFGDCGKNISSSQDGVVTSPLFPDNYPAKESKVCHWYIHVKPERKILLYFDTFIVEGDRSNRGCPAAVVRIWQDLKSTPIELCGDTLMSRYKQIISASNVMKLSFISSEKSVGQQGFRAYWTEMKDDKECDGFHCEKNGFCIPERLRCNMRANCGVGDLSDETGCATAAEVDVFMLLGVILAIVAVAGLGLCVWCRRRGEDRHRRHPTSPSHRHVHVCDHLGSRLSTMDTV